MTLARANSTNDAKFRWLDRMRKGSEYTPPRYQAKLKVPGSKKLVYGEWITVKEGDDDALTC